jgi:hypothetical protein
MAVPALPRPTASITAQAKTRCAMRRLFRRRQASRVLTSRLRVRDSGSNGIADLGGAASTANVSGSVAGFADVLEGVEDPLGLLGLAEVLQH